MKKSVIRLFSLLLSITMITTTTPFIAYATEVNDSSNLKLGWLASNSFSSDTTSGGRNGNVQGTVTWENVNGYYAAKFSNSDIWYTVSSNLLSNGICGGVEGGTGTTLAYMAYVEDNTSSSPFFCIFNNNYSTSGYKTLFSLAPNGQIIYTNSAGTSHNNLVSALKKENGWHTYVIKFYSSKSMEIYIDGTKCYGEQSDFYDNHTFDIPNSIKVGSNRENNAYFKGAIRDFRIYNKDLNATNVHNNLLTIANETKPVTNGDSDFINKINSSSIKVSFVQPKINTTAIENVSGRTYYRNILYSTSSFVANQTKTRVNGNSTYAYILMPSQTLVLYDGETAPVIPIKASFNTESVETGGYSYSTFAAIYLPGTPAFSLNNTWIGMNTENCNRSTGWPNNNSGANQLSNTNVRSGNICQVQSYSYEIGFKNGLVMNSLPTSNPISSIPFTVNQTNSESYSIISAGQIYYLDIRELKTAVANAKSQALTVAQNSTIYTSESYNEYKSKTNALINFDINSNLQTTLGLSYALSRENTAISNAISEYNTAYNSLKKLAIADLIFIDGTTQSINYNENEEPILPNNNEIISNNNGTHSTISWNKGVTSTVNGVKHTTFTQVKSNPVNCSYSSSVIQEASCTREKQTKYTCGMCNYSYIENGERLSHTLSYTDMQNGTHKGVCSLCHEESSVVIEAHSFTNYISNDNATCTQNATETAVCDKCSALHTREISSSKHGHSYKTYTVEPTCTEQGYTYEKCENCDSMNIDEESFVDALDHNYTETVISYADCVSGGIVEYSCTRCENTYKEFSGIAADKHGELIYARTVEPTAIDDGYDIYYCSNLCGYWEKKNIVPANNEANFTECLESYNFALELIVSDFSPYTSSSVDEYNICIEKALNDANTAIRTESKALLEQATKSIIEASSILRIRTISAKIYSENGVEEISTDYGETYTLSINDMSKITIEKDDVTTLLCYSDTDVCIILEEDANYYITSCETDLVNNKIVVLNRDNNVSAIYYNDDISSIKAPNVPFYKFSGWNVLSKTENETILIPIYEAK